MLFLLAGIWELIRFIVVFLSSAAAPATIPNAHLNLLWLGGPALVLAALFFSSAYYPDHIQAYVPMLRIGTAIAAITDAAVVLTGSYNWTRPGTGMTGPDAGRVLFLLAYGVLVLDLIVVSLLISYRPPRHGRPVNSPGEAASGEDQLPDYDPTDLDQE